MKRYYGLIKDKDSASLFLNKLFLAAKHGERAGYSFNPIKMLSDYAYLTEIGDNAKEKALNDMYDSGIYSESRTKDGEIAIFVDKTIGLNGIGLIDESEGAESKSVAVARFSDRLYLAVRPPMGEGPDIGWSRGLTDIRLVHHFPITYTPEQEEGEDPPEPVTELHTTEFHFGSNNSNSLAPAVVYEITPTQSYDVLVKLAWCPASTPDSEKELKSYFTSFDICCYSAAVKPREAPSAIVMKHAGKQQDVFGASGPIGGFVIHEMQKTGYGISIFGTDGTPLYTWSNNARPWDEFDSTEEYALNINVGGLGRLISDKKFSEDSDDEDTIIKMAVLAPIFCPSSSDYAKHAKWMPQGIHDYSYFDKTGHIYLKKEENMSGSTPVFFADHGVYLFDGGLDDYNLTDRTLPDSYTVNMSVIKRPELPDLMPNADRFYAYFDSRDGVSESGWANYFDSEYDMRFVGSPTINADGSVRFINRASGPAVGWFKSKYGRYNNGLSNQTACIDISVVRFSYDTWDSGDLEERWYDQSNQFVFGHVPGDDYKSVFENKYRTQMGHSIRPTSTGGTLNWQSYTNDEGWVYNAYTGNVVTNPDMSKWYIVVQYRDQNSSNEFNQNVYEITSSVDPETGEAVKSYSLITESFYHNLALAEYIYARNEPVPMRYYIGGYPANDSSWRTQSLQGGSASSRVMNWPSNSYEVAIDVAFIALADAGADIGWRNGGYNIDTSKILQFLADHFGN